jgi:hypothetical protein
MASDAGGLDKAGSPERGDRPRTRPMIDRRKNLVPETRGQGFSQAVYIIFEIKTYGIFILQ